MKVIIDMDKEYFDKVKKQAEKDFQKHFTEMNDGDNVCDKCGCEKKYDGFRFELDIPVDNTDHECYPSEDGGIWYLSLQDLDTDTPNIWIETDLKDAKRIGLTRGEK